MFFLHFLQKALASENLNEFGINERRFIVTEDEVEETMQCLIEKDDSVKTSEEQGIGEIQENISDNQEIDNQQVEVYESHDNYASRDTESHESFVYDLNYPRGFRDLHQNSVNFPDVVHNRTSSHNLAQRKQCLTRPTFQDSISRTIPENFDFTTAQPPFDRRVNEEDNASYSLVDITGPLESNEASGESNNPRRPAFNFTGNKFNEDNSIGLEIQPDISEESRQSVSASNCLFAFTTKKASKARAKPRGLSGRANLIKSSGQWTSSKYRPIINTMGSSRIQIEPIVAEASGGSFDSMSYIFEHKSETTDTDNLPSFQSEPAVLEASGGSFDSTSHIFGHKSKTTNKQPANTDNLLSIQTEPAVLEASGGSFNSMSHIFGHKSKTTDKHPKKTDILPGHLFKVMDSLSVDKCESTSKKFDKGSEKSTTPVKHEEAISNDQANTNTFKFSQLTNKDTLYSIPFSNPQRGNPHRNKPAKNKKARRCDKSKSKMKASHNSIQVPNNKNK